jgi:hypothetical protein
MNDAYRNAIMPRAESGPHVKIMTMPRLTR